MSLRSLRPQLARHIYVPSKKQQCCYGTSLGAGHETFPYEAVYQSLIDKKKVDKSYRYFRSITRIQNEFPFAICARTGKKVNVWCSNDYLAMGSSPTVITAMQHALQTYGANSGGSRNIAGHSPLVEALEASIAELHKKPAALYFSSGFAANEAALSTLGSQLSGCVIFSDELNHASMIEGIRHSGARKVIWRHNDLGHLEELLASFPKSIPKIIAFESLYSMCGTVAPITAICDLAEKYGAITFMDEAHAIGLYGPRGAGVAEHLDFTASQSNYFTGRTIMDRVDVISGSTSKGLGTMGGYIASSRRLIDMIRSVAKGFIFTTTQSPAVMAGAHAAIQYQLHSIGSRIMLHRNVTSVKRKMSQFDLPILPNRSHLVPVMVGDAELTRRVTDLLFDEYNIYVQPINSPTVAVKTERFRISPTGAHGPAQQDALVSALVEIWDRLSLRKASDWRREQGWDDVASGQLWTDEQLKLVPSIIGDGHMRLPTRERLEDTMLSSALG
ncbi:5-aminolevulinate synthase [Xylaria grammica]|nr:5-aminolevulinate synthase [Xylaria grammica]